MAFAPPIQIRLHPEKLAAYEAEASERNMTLADYLRQRLDDPERLAEEIARIRLLLTDFMEREPRTASAAPSTDAGMLLEILLLTRQRAKPEELRMWQAEVGRNGLKVWSGKS